MNFLINNKEGLMKKILAGLVFGILAFSSMTAFADDASNNVLQQQQNDQSSDQNTQSVGNWWPFN
jgi:hypothetical protein